MPRGLSKLDGVQMLVHPTRRVYRRAFSGKLTAHERSDIEFARTRCGKPYDPTLQPAHKRDVRGYCAHCAIS